MLKQLALIRQIAISFHKLFAPFPPTLKTRSSASIFPQASEVQIHREGELSRENSCGLTSLVLPLTSSNPGKSPLPRNSRNTALTLVQAVTTGAALSLMPLCERPVWLLLC